MKSLSSFLNPKRKENLKFVLSDAFIGEDDKPIEWEMRQLSAEEGLELQKQSESREYSEVMTGYIAASLVYPNLKNKELLEGLLNSQEESRLVITSDAENISERVLLKGYEKQEPYSGVYEVTIKFIEYKEVNVRTTDVPYIKRPGKMPTPPKSVVINKDNSAGEVAAKATKGQLVPDMFLTSFEDKFGKNTNPCLFKDGDECRIKVTTPQKGYEKFGLTASGMAHDNIENTIKSISKAFTDYRKKNEDLLIKAGGKKVW